MSWHHEAHHKTKEAAKAHAAKNLVHAPEPVKAMLHAAIDALPDQEGSISVKTNGHVERPHEADGKVWGHSRVHVEIEHKPFPHD